MTAAGPSLGVLSDFRDGTATAASYDAGGREIALLVLRRGTELLGYLDLCPHQFLPLTYRGGRVLSDDGERLRCTSHGAEFAAADGRALSGPVRCGLTAVALRLDDDGTVRIDATPDERNSLTRSGARREGRDP